ncbi:class I SAM-dependent methyltransferase [Ruegeria conchae]|uniref:Methyltransferase family protein n=1 Tax=Ruegeria conchae TaxID=981384 RepID=A0A497Z9K9_9RHOB|nr:class I SAM-dependent methyltransferase [Ruegeria conchae]RLK03563.1 methyltransferase family protein [Ruegeria conchae]
MKLHERCRLCGGTTELRSGYRFGQFDLFKCGACGFQQIDPEPSGAELQELYGTLYFQKAKYTDPKAIELEYERRHNLMARAGFKPEDSLLEIGCGAGQFIATCADTYNWYGMDFSEAGIEEARTRLPNLPADRLRSQSVEDFNPSLPDGGFDGVLIFDTIEHVYDPQPVLKRAASWLKPGGRMIVTTPDIGANMAKLTGRRWPFMTPPEHLSFFTRPAMVQALKSAGLYTSYSKSMGKYANVAFIVYKAGRVGLLPKSLGKLAVKMGLGKLTIYVPTGDVMYMIAEKQRDA